MTFAFQQFYSIKLEYPVWYLATWKENLGQYFPELVKEQKCLIFHSLTVVVFCSWFECRYLYLYLYSYSFISIFILYSFFISLLHLGIYLVLCLQSRICSHMPWQASKREAFCFCKLLSKAFPLLCLWKLQINGCPSSSNPKFHRRCIEQHDPNWIRLDGASAFVDCKYHCKHVVNIGAHSIQQDFYTVGIINAMSLRKVA